MKTLVGCTLLAALLGARVACPQERFDSAARAKVIAPFVDEQTAAVVHADFSRGALPPLLDRFARMVPEAEADVTQMKRVAGAWLAGFARAGGRDAYLVVSMADMRFRREYRPPIILPRYQGTDVRALAALFPKPYELKDWSGGVLVAADAETFKRLQTLKPDNRPELVEAFRAAGDTAAQELLLPPKYAARVIDGMLPQLPKEIGGGPSTVITRGLRWAAVGVDLAPQVSVRLVVQSQDAKAAEGLRRWWGDCARAIGNLKEVKRAARGLADVAAQLAPQVRGDRLVLELKADDERVKALRQRLTPLLQEARQGAERVESMNDLKQIGLAMHMYHEAHKCFPPAASHDAQGRPLLSWRVALLPYLGQEPLYKQFHLDEPWDSEHNRKLIEQMPAIYRSPASRRKERGYTSYLVPVGKETVFPTGGKGMPFNEIKDGTSNTIMAVEADDAHAVPWTRPEDLPFDAKDPAKGLGGPFPGGFNALFCDGSVRFLALPQPADKLRALFTPSGGEVVSP